MKSMFFCFLLLLGGVSAWGQCPTGDILLTTQAQVDNFAVNYPGCTEVLGSVKIDNPVSNILNLNGLAFIQSIQGGLTIQNLNAQNLNGLNSLTQVEGNVTISFNNLVNLNGLDSLKTIGGWLQIEHNPFLENISGLGSLTNIMKSLYFGQNNLIESIGLESLTTVGEDIYISDNSSLKNLDGIQNLSQVGKGIYLHSNSVLNSISGLHLLTSIPGNLGISGTILNNLHGLEGISTIGGSLSITDSSGIPNLSAFESLTTIGDNLNISGNTASLEGLDMLTSIGDRILIYDNDSITNLQGLNALSSLESLYIEYCDNLTNLEGLSSIPTIEDLSLISNPSLTNLDALNSLTQVENLIIISNNDNLTSISGLNGASMPSLELVVIKNNDALTNLNGLEGLSAIETNLKITGNAVLSSLDGLNNLNFVSEEIIITDNPLLIDCGGVNAICTQLITNPTSVTIVNNTSGCNSPVEVLQTCDSINIASGFAYTDIDCNGVFDGQDHLASELVFNNLATNLPIAASNYSGFYAFLISSSVNFEYTVNPYPGFTVHPESHTIVTNTVPQQYPNRDFRLCPDSLFHNLKTTLTSITVPRPGFTNQYQVCAQNLGTQPENAVLTLDFSIGSNAQYITIIDAAGGTVQNNVITWNISDLQLCDSECFTVTIQLTTNTPLGVYLQPKSNVSLSPLQTEIKYTDNSVELRDEVVGSYDPNDKTVDMPNITYDPTSGVTRLQYKIRFQNTGTFPATFIEVLDTLESKLDIRTIEMVAASHDYTLSFPSPNVLKWRFDNIYLPDSTSNEPESHGFVVFNISTKTPINLGEMVQNRAGIYFDFNEPVITNYATTSFTVGVHDPFGLGSLPLAIAPNPTQDNIILRYNLTESADSELLITNAQGVVVVSQRLGKQGVGDYALPVDLAGLPAGLYLVTVRAGRLVGAGKVVRL